MRPTEQRISTGLVQQESSIKPVGVQVAARPVALAVDDTQSKQLAILQQQLNAFTGGASQVADVMQEEYVQGEQDQAQQDFMKNPKQTPEQIAAGDQSSYYKTSYMRLLGDSAGLDLAAQVDAEAKRLLEQPDELKSIDVDAHMGQFIQKSFAGLQDNDVLSTLLPRAEKLLSTYALQLKQAQLSAHKEDVRQNVWETVYKGYDAKDASPESVLNNWQETKAAVGEEDAMKFHISMLKSKIQGAKDSVEAGQWLNLFNMQLPGTSVTMRAIGGPAIQEEFDRLRNYVGTLAANEKEARITAMNEERAAQEKAQKDAWSTNESLWELSLSKTNSPEDIGRAEAGLEHALQSNLIDPSKAPMLVQRLAIRKQEVYAESGFEAARRAKLGIQLSGEDGGKAAKRLSDEFLEKTTQLTGPQMNKWYADTVGFMAKSAPGQLPDLNKQVFEGAANSAIEVVSGGANVAVPSRLMGQVQAYQAAKSMGFTALAGIPDRDHVFLGQVAQGIENGLTPQQSIMQAHKNVSGNRATLNAAQREEALADILSDGDVTQNARLGFINSPVFKEKVGQKGLGFISDVARYELSLLTLPEGTKPSDAAEIVAKKLQSDFLLVSESGITSADSGLIYLGSNYVKGKKVVIPAAQVTQMKMGLQAFYDYQETLGNTVDIHPVDRNGNHEVSLTNKNGITSTVVLPISAFIDLGVSMAQEKAKVIVEAQKKGLLDKVGSALSNPSSLVGLSKGEIAALKRSELTRQLEVARQKALNEGIQPIGAGPKGAAGPAASKPIDSVKYQGVNFGFVPVPQVSAPPKVTASEKRVAVQGAKRNLGLELPPPPPVNLPPEPPPIPKPKK